ncbi:MAG: choice-of-anchor D domain-containing protein, partial [Myxococcota bacterium]
MDTTTKFPMLRTARWGALLVLVLIGCEESEISRLEARLLAFDPQVPPADRPSEGLTQLDFGDVPVGIPEVRPLGIRNIGTDTLTVCVSGASVADCVSDTAISPSNASFVIEFENIDLASGTWSVASGQSREVAVRFSPTTEGRFAAILRIVHNGADGGVTTIALTGRAIAPEIEVSPRAVEFGNTTVGRRRLQTIILTNPTPFPVTIQVPPFSQQSPTFGLIRPTGEELAVDESLSIVVAASSTTSFDVWFQPAAEREYGSEIELSFCDNCQRTLFVRGRGVRPAFLLDPGRLSFGEVSQGRSVVRSFEVINVGNVDLEVFSVDTERGTSDAFKSSLSGGPLPRKLRPDERMTVDVAYTALAPGPDQGRIEVVTDAWDDAENQTSTAVGYVSLEAISQGANILPFPPQVLFGVVPVTSQRTRRLALQNAGNEPLTIFDVQLTGSAEVRLSPEP